MKEADHSSILEKIASKENCRPAQGAYVSKAQIAVQQRARSRAEAQRQKSRQGESRSKGKYNAAVRIRNVHEQRTQVYVKAGAEDEYNGVTLDNRGPKDLSDPAPTATEPDTALRADQSEIGSPTPNQLKSFTHDKLGEDVDETFIRTLDDEKFGSLNGASTGNNTKRTSVLKVKHGEAIQNASNLVRFSRNHGEDQRRSTNEDHRTQDSDERWAQ